MTEEQTPLSEQALVAREVLENMLREMEFPGAVEVEETEEQVLLTITSEAPMGLLIGKGGQTLNALELIVKQITQHKTGNYGKHLVLDAEGYRSRTADRLTELAVETAERVRDTGETIEMEPMSPRDRRTVHLALQEMAGVETYSKGEDPYRRVVVCPAGQKPEWAED
ncbi:MAG TPA: R3H domain-containing nucleic acid-binding protein [Armatimonadota bacterium]|jgi:spoIIIJ-associated protein